MTQLYGLFSNQKEAEQAIEALAQARLDNSVIHTMEKWNKDDTPVAVPSVHAGSGGPAGGAMPLTAFLPDISVDNDAKRFFQRSLEKGGVLVAVDPEDDVALVQAKRILEEQGGQVLSD